MIRVTIEVDHAGHDFKIEREEEFLTSDAKTTVIVDRLLAETRASMHAALTAVPKSALWVDISS